MKNTADKNVLVTGGAGFIGSNFVRLALQQRPDWNVIALDLLTYAGNLDNLADLSENPRCRFVKADICDRDALEPIFRDGVHCVVNFAAESHVDRSIMDASAFVRTNVLGTQLLLDLARLHDVSTYLHVGTDEVYGSLGATGRFTETSPLEPNNPYAASKAAADLLVLACHKTHGVPCVVTRCSNNYGPFQFPEKVIPLFCTNLIQGEQVPLYGDGLNVRDWIHVRDHCEAVLAVAQRGTPGEVYNISAEVEVSNVDLTHAILREFGRDESMIRHVEDRAAHDRRYALDPAKIRDQLGWEAKIDFDDGLRETIDWYRQNEEWWRAIKTGDYLQYYERQYGRR